MASGMATSDDVVALEATHQGSHARVVKWGEFHRGLGSIIEGPDDVAEEGALNLQLATQAGIMRLYITVFIGGGATKSPL